MITVGIVEAKSRLAELVERAASGELINITRRGETVARLMPPDTARARDQVPTMAAQIRRSRAQYALGAEVSIGELIEDGRR